MDFATRLNCIVSVEIEGFKPLRWFAFSDTIGYTIQMVYEKQTGKPLTSEELESRFELVQTDENSKEVYVKLRERKD